MRAEEKIRQMVFASSLTNNKITIRQLAELTGRHYSMFTKYFNGESDMPHEMIVAIANIFGVSVDYLTSNEPIESLFEKSEMTEGERLRLFMIANDINAEQIATRLGKSKSIFTMYYRANTLGNILFRQIRELIIELYPNLDIKTYDNIKRMYLDRTKLDNNHININKVEMRVIKYPQKA